MGAHAIAIDKLKVVRRRFAALHMNDALGFSAAAFGFGSGIFLLGYCLPNSSIQQRFASGEI